MISAKISARRAWIQAGGRGRATSFSRSITTTPFLGTLSSSNTFAGSRGVCRNYAERAKPPSLPPAARAFSFGNIDNSERTSDLRPPHRSFSTGKTNIPPHSPKRNGGEGATSASASLRLQHHHTPDHLIVIGTGVAGCSTALVAAARYSIPVTLLCAGDVPTDCNSYWAQGGIIYRNYDPTSGDNAESLIDDVTRAGAGLCEPGAVAKLAFEGPDRVRELLLGSHGDYADVPFDRREDGELSCCIEASHSAPRIIHYADHSGKAITEHITAAAMSHPLITVVPNAIVTDLITERRDGRGRICLGASVYDVSTGRRTPSPLLSNRGVAVASGGLCGIYAHTTNPSGFNAVGSGVAAASRAGAATADLEYVQFHPTALNVPNEPRFLLTEALRGEGALLVDGDGRRFAQDFHPMGELAPRDVVARGVFAQQMQGGGGEGDGGVYLDISHRDANYLHKRFPSIHHRLMGRYGLDIARDRLPITPAAHYSCGGVASDSHGRTNVSNLYVAGEAARTGLHGGNRLASTSLLEGLVWGASIADFLGGNAKTEMATSTTTTGRKNGEQRKNGERENGQFKNGQNNGTIAIAAQTSCLSAVELREWAREEVACYSPSNHATSTGGGGARARNGTTSNGINGGNGVVAARRRDAANRLLSQVRSTMWNDVGVVRNTAGLARACGVLNEIREQADELYGSSVDSLSVETIMLRDASYAGLQVARAAAKNRVSRGAHCVVLDDQDKGHEERSGVHEAELHGWEDWEEQVMVM